MICARKALLSKLKTILPAVCEHDLVPVNTHFVFTGDQIVAYNERIAMAVPQPSDFRGTIAARLIEVLGRSNAVAVEVLADTGQVLLKLGSTSINLPSIPLSDFHFQMPPPPTRNIIAGVAARFFDAVQHCLQSVAGTAAVLPDQQGVTVIPDGKTLELFATNTTALSYAKLKLDSDSGLNERIILGPEFCTQMFKLAAMAQMTRLSLDKEQALFMADDVLLYGRLIEEEQPMDFKGALQRHLPKDFAERAVAIPPELGRFFQRAALVTNIKGNEAPTRITIQGGTAHFHSESERGLVNESIALPGHPDVKVAFNAAQFVKARARYDRVLFTDKLATLADASGERLYLVATYKTEEGQRN
jgi:DNA polymerase III sliding clamp (beta) subunit (PCNA family)